MRFWVVGQRADGLAHALALGDVDRSVLGGQFQFGCDDLGIDRRGGAQPGAVDGEVARDRQHPRRHPAAAGVVRGGVAPHAHERLLRHVLGQIGIAQHRHRQPVHATLEAPNERGGSLRVPGAQPGQQGLVGDSFH
jgi:hypothetical protein